MTCNGLPWGFSRNAGEIRRETDSLLEGNGFEPLVPQRKSPRFPKHSGHRGRLPPGRMSSRPFTDFRERGLPDPRIGLAGPSHRRRPGPASQELTTATASDPDKQDAALPVSPDPIP